MPDNDLSFTFNTKFFEQGIAKVSKGMQSLQTTANTVAKGITKGLTTMVVKIGSVVAAFKGLKGVLNQLPEIGKAFGIAKDTFLKNLLFPLRMQVLPLLQKMLDWVRDNRTTFVKWGVAITNVFRVIVSAAKRVIAAGQEIFEKISGIFKRLFGDQVKSWEEAWNILIFKLAVGAEFIGAIAQRVLGFFGELVERFGPDILSLFGGIAKFIIDLAKTHWPAFEDAIFATGDLISKWMKKWLPVVGELLSDAIGFFLDLWTNDVIPALDNLFDLFDRIFIKSKLIHAVWNLVKTAIRGIVQIFDSFIVGFSSRADDIGANLESIFTTINDMIEGWLHPDTSGNSLLTFAQKVGDLFSDIVADVTMIVDSIIKGFAGTTTELPTALVAIIDTFQRIHDLIFKDEGGIKSFFEGLGGLLGNVLLGFLNNINTILEGIEAAIKFIQKIAAPFSPSFSREIEGIEVIPLERKGIVDDTKFPSFESLQAPSSQENKVVKTFSFDLGGIEVFGVSGDPAVIGQEIGKSLMNTLESEFDTEFNRGGN